jgi:hypothetical protein
VANAGAPDFAAQYPMTLRSAAVDVRATAVAIAAGIALGFVYTLSPMTVWFCVASVVLVRVSGRGLTVREARTVQGILVAALLVRLALVAWLFRFGSSDDMWFNTFFGDEDYDIVRSFRLRTLWIGGPISGEAFLGVYDQYGWTSYLNVIAFVQLFVGPAPYGIHLLNALFFCAAASLFHRLVRYAFGRVEAILTLATLLLWPSIMMWSASALKESINFLVVTILMISAVAAVRASWRWRVVAALVTVGGILMLGTFRAGALEIALGGVVGGLALRFVTRRGWRIIAVAVLIAVAVPVAARSARVQNAALRYLRPAARMHLGHVLTRGHAYKLIDQRFYESHVTDDMTLSEAGAFVRRALVSVVLLPRPWDSRSVYEVLYIPEQMAWYVVILTAMVGLVIGLRRDALVTSLFASYAVAALVAVALNSGNIGTLVRHRALALPFLLPLSAVSFTALRKPWR